MEEEILDLESSAQRLNLASKGVRFGNYMIDGFLVPMVILFGIMAVYGMDYYMELSSDFRLNLLIYGIYIVYYTALESYGGKTLGKLITRTKVVTEQGGKPSFGQCLGRSFSRLVPFEAFSFLGSKPIGWHDRWTKTRVVKD